MLLGLKDGMTGKLDKISQIYTPNYLLANGLDLMGGPKAPAYMSKGHWRKFKNLAKAVMTYEGDGEWDVKYE